MIDAVAAGYDGSYSHRVLVDFFFKKYSLDVRRFSDSHMSPLFLSDFSLSVLSIGEMSSDRCLYVEG